MAAALGSIERESFRSRLVTETATWEVARFFATGWPVNYWRIDTMTDTDFEWFEHKYPGWYDKYGKWWERYADYSVKNGHKPIAFEPGAVPGAVALRFGRGISHFVPPAGPAFLAFRQPNAQG